MRRQPVERIHAAEPSGNGYQLTTIDDYPQKLNAVTLDQVNAAIKKPLTPDTFVFTKTGTVPTAPN